jgi:hypothetical protein
MAEACNRLSEPELHAFTETEVVLVRPGILDIAEHAWMEASSAVRNGSREWCAAPAIPVLTRACGKRLSTVLLQIVNTSGRMMLVATCSSWQLLLMQSQSSERPSDREPKDDGNVLV